MTLFFKYLKQQRRLILMLTLFFTIFLVVFFLYRLPIGAVMYPSLLCLLFGALFAIHDYIKLKRKHNELERIASLDADMIDELPFAGRIDDEDYSRIIRKLKSETASLETEFNTKYKDMIDYYTIWAHQIKTPIASMRLDLQNEDTPLSRRLRSDLFRIEQYVEMVLAFLRLDSTSSDYVFKEYKLDNIVRRTVKKFSNDFINKKISLEYQPIDLSIVTDEKWLSFVLEQIISNAIKYTREGSVKIYMREQNVLCIEDTGIGIAPEDLPRIFDKGYTGYNGRTDKKASGIGLYLCKRVCDALGIGITARSSLGEGTIISLDLEQYKLRRE